MVDAQPMLDGYSFLEWPDLSACRHPLDATHVSEQPLVFSRPEHSSHLILAVSRILGAYCGTSDILIALGTTIPDLFTIIRVSWSDSNSWGDILPMIEQQIHSTAPVTFAAMQTALDLNDKQSPCVAVCHLTSQPSRPSQSFPLTFTYDVSDGRLSLAAYLKHLHPSVSSQIIAQVALTIGYIEQHPASSISHVDLPPHLMSECSRTRNEKDLATVYPHVPLVAFTTDYLTRRATTHPTSTALQWYPDLSATPDLFEAITYASLHQRANQTAKWLRKIGLEDEDRVAICMPRDVLFHVAMIAIMRAGGCYVPIDPDLPSERKAYIARDSDARFVLTTPETSPTSLFEHRTIFYNDKLTQKAIEEETCDDVNFASPKGLAFLLYTSGTTGNPKGCLLTHEGLSQVMVALGNTAADVRMSDLTSGRYLAIASVAFDVHLGETFVPIALGMPLLSAPRSQLLENLPFYVKSFGITHIGIVPSLIEATLNAASGTKGGTDMALRYIASGGEKMSDAILDKWADHPCVRLANFYGPSEATIGCCGRFMDPETPRANIGRTFANTAGYVVDSNLNILPRGGTGELVVEGPLVGRGYHGRPDLTEKVFLEWPQKGDWTYRTGDLVRMMPDSTIEILGRIDSQIKLRGVRIESEGISSIIRKAAPVSSEFALDAATILGKHPSIGTEQLVSFVTWDPSVSIATRKSQKPTILSPPAGLLGQIQHICEVELARYMRPSHIIPLSWLPLSSNGKADIKVLAGIFHSLELDSLSRLMATMHQSQTETRPATKTEEAVFSILGRSSTIPLTVAIPDLNIFACGLDSMAVIQFSKDLYEKFGHRIPPSDIMSTPTLAGIASLLDGMTDSSSASETVSYTAEFSSRWSDKIRSAFGAGAVECILPPFSVQEGVLARSADNHTMYVQHVIFACNTGTVTTGLRRAWEVVVSKHSILRTVFFFGQELAQVVLTADQRPLPWSEEQTDIGEDKEFVAWFLGTRAPAVARDINTTLSESPPFRFSSFTAQGRTFLVFSIHHALYDGISLPLLFQNVEREYRGDVPQAVPSLPDILDCIASIDLAKARNFWLEHYRDFVWPQNLPVQRETSSTIHSVLQLRSTLSSLKDLSASQNVTLQTVLTAAFAALAATRIYSTKDVSFGIIRSGRLLPVDDVENAICPMVSVIPTRVNFGEAGNVLHKIQSRASAMVEVEHVPLGKVQKWVRPSGGTLFELLFSVSLETNEVETDIWDILQSEFPQADYALSVEVVLDPRNDTVVVQAAWMNDRLDESVVRELLGDFESIILDVGAGRILSHLSGVSSSTTGIFEDLEDTNTEYTGIISDPRLLIKLRGAISEFLSINEELLNDDVSFITVGLDSIKSVGLARTLRKLGHDIRAEEIMKFSSLRMLTNFLTAGRVASHRETDHSAFLSTSARIQSSFSVDDIKLSSTDSVMLFPTTTLQAGMLTQTISSQGSLYVHAFPLKLVSGVLLDELERACLQVIETFDILRTSFHFSPESGLWAQAVHSTSITKVTRDDFATKEDYEHKLSIFIASAKPTKESDLHTPPIWIRVFVPSPTSPEGARLVLIMHHSLYDGLSVGMLLDAIQSMYRRSESTSLTRPPQFHSLLRYILDQEEAGVSFWTQTLNGFHPSTLPIRAEFKHHISSHIISQTFSYDPGLLNIALRRSAATVQCLGQAVWGKLMIELIGSTDVVFGHTVSGRSIPDAEDVIGPVLNTIPCRIRLQEGLSNIDLLRSIHKHNVDALPWQHASLRSIQRKMGFSQLWESLFLFQPRIESDIAAEPLWSFETEEDEEAQIQYAFALELHQLENSFTLKAACRPEYMEEVQLKALLDRFQKLFETLINHLDAFALDDVLLQISEDRQRQTSSVPNQIQEAPILPEIKSLLVAITNMPPTTFSSITPLAALGIDSITAIQIVSRFRQAGLALSTNDVITSRTIGEMAAKVRPWVDDNILEHRSMHTLHVSDEERAGIVSRIGSLSDSIEDILPTSSGMKWLIGSWQRSGRTSFHHAFAFKLAPDVDISKLHESWTSLLKHLPLLRSTFACAYGESDPRIVIFKPGSFPDTWSNEHASGGQGPELVATRIRELLSSPPSMTTPPTRAILYQSSEANYLILYLHHFQYDAWCLPLIIDDLLRIYLGLAPVSSNNIRPFLQVSGPTEENLSQQKIYWQRSLGETFVPVLFPTLLPKLSETLARTIYTSHKAICGASICADRARSLGVTLPSVFLACWALVQSSYTSSSSATLGLWQAGRSGLLDDISQLASPCLNVVPMCIPVPEGSATIDIAKDISSDLRDRSPVIAQSNLIDVNRWVGASERPLCNVVVNIIPTAPETTTKAELMEQVELPFYIPSMISVESNPTVDLLAITKLVQNDIIVDFAVLPQHDTILMSIDVAAHMMDSNQAESIVEQWASTVRDTLGIS